MAKDMRVKLRPLAIISCAALILFGFQNCGNEVAFKDAETLSELGFNPEDVLCNPLAPAAVCDLNSKSGLIGNLYYLTPDQASLFGGQLGNAVLNDYIVHGTRINKLLLMGEVNVPTQDWTVGFVQADGSYIKDLNGNTLHEWFSIDLDGFISLPAGSYQFALMSDDGMKVSFNNEVILNDDGIHSPRYKCSESVTFTAGEKKKLDIQYFQGPRTQIAMQLLMRPAAEMSSACGSTGGWQPVGSSAYSYSL